MAINRRENYKIDYKSVIYFSYNAGDLISSKFQMSLPKCSMMAA